MIIGEAGAGDLNQAVMRAAAGRRDLVLAGGIWRYECRDPEGNLKWEEMVENLVVDQALNHILNVVLGEKQSSLESCCTSQ